MQPLSVSMRGYRLRMTTPYKPRLVLRIIDAVQARMADPTLDRPRAETALRNLGMSPGSAQRLLDDSTDVRIGTLIDAASRLGTSGAALLSATISTDNPSLSVAPTAITRDQALASALEVIGQALAVEMPPDHRAELADALSAWAKYAGRDRYRATVAELLVVPAAPPAKRSNAA